MGKVTPMPLAGPDHPIYTGGPVSYTPRLGQKPALPKTSPVPAKDAAPTPPSPLVRPPRG